MQPTILWLTDNGNTFSGKAFDAIDVPAQGSTTLYVMFDYPDTDNAFTIRWRTRARQAGQDGFGEWGTWASYDEVIAPQPNDTRRISLHAFTYSSSQVRPAGPDLLEFQVQAKRQGTPDDDWGPVSVFKVRCLPTAAAHFAQTYVNQYALTVQTSWLRNASSIRLDAIRNASSGLQLLALPGRIYQGIVKDGFASIPPEHFARVPERGEMLDIAGAYITQDGATVPFTLTDALDYEAANTFTATATPLPEEGAIRFLVTDNLDGGIPLVAVVVQLRDPMTSSDTFLATPGVAVLHRCPRLDVPLVYDIVARSAGGNISTGYVHTSLSSAGRLWFNWGPELSRRLTLEMNTDWQSEIERPKQYFTRARGFPAVFYGRSTKQELTVSGDIFYPAGRDELTELACADGVVILRAPYGERYSVAVDAVEVSDRAGDLQTEVSLDLTRVG
jgi:hypothetical protein